MPSPAPDLLSLDLYDQPGHLIRRAQQIATQLFRDVLGPDVTPVQYAILRMLQESPGIDQVTLARLVALDNSTTADIAARLESKGWIHREILPRRQRRLSLTAEGEAMLASFVPMCTSCASACSRHWSPRSRRSSSACCASSCSCTMPAKPRPSRIPPRTANNRSPRSARAGCGSPGAMTD